ncbi:hypothetical protein BDQ12DRAFT_709481 [Crucibulum laeve]|uniref:Proteophosphoglycan ppg4 n=1 Tax=Crucibulum laeve TaxID=68775 RepID=A0A5C3MGL7_9AGAR|nr:hypothetical protein BDQ12DRAFT_709481 [Crucibulum laeve]
MLSIRLYEHHDFSTRPVIPPTRPRRPYHDLLMSFISSTSLTTVVILMPCFWASSAAASPILDTRLQSRALGSGDGSQSLSPKIWVPILIVILILFSIATISWYKGKGLRFFNFAGSAAAASGAAITGGTRELTAEQLAGTINNGAANNTSAAGTTGGTRRPRRPRRTPSQISTTSLPAYNKEPGDEELVIFRGPQDMEDAGMPTAIVMPSVDEDGEASIHTGDHSQVSRYSPMPTSPNSMPLLHDEFSGDLSMQSLQPPPGEDMPRRSYETINSSHETSSLMRIETSMSEQESDPRGEAPAYFEVVDNTVDLSSQPRSSSNPNAPTIPSASSPPSSPERNTQRRSGFRSLLNRMTVTGSHHTQSSSHARADSGHSVMPTSTSHRRDGSSIRASHRPSQSGSGSMFRTLSRQKSNTTLGSNRLNSPSLISLNSISPPLTHTAVRSEFTYPKAGPTPEQLKLISSRESFARFGMPYGADAIAFAASASRQDLEPPPPDFDAAGSESQLPRSAGPSRLRSTSNAADSQESGDGSGSSLSDGDHSHSERSPSPRSPERERATTTSNTEPTNSTLTTAIPAIHNTQTSDESNSLSVTSEATADDAHNSTSSAASPPPATPTIPPPTSMLSAPPSSFHPSSPLVRSESRASSFSMQSFATAEESLSASTPLASPSRVDLSQISGPPTPTTPKMGGLHVLEATDVTITHPGNVTTPATSVQA